MGVKGSWCRSSPRKPSGPALEEAPPSDHKKGKVDRAPAVSSIATAAGPFMSTCHVLASQPLMAAGSSSRLPGKTREGGLTCWPPFLSFP